MVLQSLSWVTDSNLEINRKRMEELEEALSSPKFKIHSREKYSLQKGMTLFKMKLELLSEETITLSSGYIISTFAQLSSLVEQLSYYPLEFSLLQTFNNSLHLNMMVVLENCRSLITHYLQTKLQMKADYIDIQSFIINVETGAKVIKFLPYYQSQRLYDSSENGAAINKILNLNFLMNYHYLSENPLVFWILTEKLETSLEFLFYEGSYLLKETEGGEHLEILQTLQNYENEGYFTVPSRMNTSGNIFIDLVYPELAMAWGIALIDSWTTESQKVHCFQMQEIFTSSPTLFLEENAKEILQGKIPLYNFTSSVEQSSLRSKLHYQYYIIKAYLSLVNVYPSLFSYLSSITLERDSSITARFSSLAQVKKYQEILSSLSSSGEEILIESVNSLQEALAVRWYYHTQNNHLNTLIIKRNKKYHVVVPISSGTDLSPFTEGDKSSVKETLQRYEKDLISNLKEYYIQCRNDEDIITREKISSMNLLELLGIIIWKSGTEQHCFSQENVVRVGLYVNPATGLSLDDRTIKVMKQHEYGILGYFSYGVLPGILKDVPEVPLLNIQKGSLSFNIVNEEMLTIDLIIDREYLAASSWYEQNTIGDYLVSLAEINISKKAMEEVDSKFIPLFEKLWKEGRLFSDWSYLFFTEFGKMSRLPLKERKLVTMAAEDTYHGESFLRYVEDIV